MFYLLALPNQWWRSLLLFGGLGLSVLGHTPARAQTAAQVAARYRYWQAPVDSLRWVLATQRADTARLRTLLHLYDVGEYAAADAGERYRELAQLTRRLRRPDAAAFRLTYAAVQLHAAGTEPARELDSLRAAVEAFDRLRRPVPALLPGVYLAFRLLKQREAPATYFQAKLAQYQARGARENLTICHYVLGSLFVSRGDYNQGISYYLHSADLASTYDRYGQENQLKLVGDLYAEWGNPAKALHYLRQSLAVRAALPQHNGYNPTAFTYRAIAQTYRRLGDYPAALRYANLALQGDPADTTRHYAAGAPSRYAHGLVVKSEVLLDMNRIAEVGPLLARAQQLADSLKLGIYNRPGGLFDLDATWARYYAVRGEPARAETAWLVAYRKARESKRVPQRLAYLHGLADFYAQRGQTAPAGRYARMALALSDSLATQQGAFHVAQYEGERAEQAQQARIAALREAQLLDDARARRQRWALAGVLVVLALIGGFSFLLWRSNRRQQRANALLSQQKAEIQIQRDQTTQALSDLRATQAQLIQKEKMASLGELTAGIAHEIQNPLNFVNNFSEVSAELMLELEEAQAAGDGEEVTALATDVRQNLVKITEHGHRAAGIVRGMLEHSRSSTGERVPTDLNQLCDEYLRLAYHGLRAKDKSFSAELKTDFAPALPLVEGVGADLGRVLLNLFNNAFYAVQQRQQTGEPGYVPTVSVSTKQVGQQVELRVSDNGTGMSVAVQQKIFQPFFTTKPTGEGTGLGLSLSHDIIAQGHGGTLSVESQEGKGTAFTISLPN